MGGQGEATAGTIRSDQAARLIIEEALETRRPTRSRAATTPAASSPGLGIATAAGRGG
jgi:hypothetical protein